MAGFLETRISSGVPGLDELLGGGYLPGTLVAVVGATGIGKTQLGLQFAYAGGGQPPGVILDMTARGDSQNHVAYAQRMFRWSLAEANGDLPVGEQLFQSPPAGHYMHAFTCGGRRVTRDTMTFEEWQQWQADINRRILQTIGFLYGHFVHGVRRVVVDGIEPVERPADSIQFYLFDYVYHQIVRKDPQWVARDLFRERYWALHQHVQEHTYEPTSITCVLLITAQHGMLDDLITRPLDEGDFLANAATLIYMGKFRDGTRLRRALYIAKHRGSACSDALIPYQITDRGIVIEQ